MCDGIYVFGKLLRIVFLLNCECVRAFLVRTFSPSPSNILRFVWLYFVYKCFFTVNLSGELKSFSQIIKYTLSALLVFSSFCDFSYPSGCRSERNWLLQLQQIKFNIVLFASFLQTTSTPFALTTTIALLFLVHAVHESSYSCNCFYCLCYAFRTSVSGALRFAVLPDRQIRHIFGHF